MKQQCFPVTKHARKTISQDEGEESPISEEEDEIAPVGPTKKKKVEELDEEPGEDANV